jgi:hypothetical protein
MRERTIPRAQSDRRGGVTTPSRHAGIGPCADGTLAARAARCVRIGSAGVQDPGLALGAWTASAAGWARTAVARRDAGCRLGPRSEVSGNDIHGNGLLGIDLGFDGVTPNDAGDADDGANGLQNFPVILAATAFGSSVQVAGVLHSRPSRDYRIEVFANAECDPTGNGEGEAFLGSLDVTTDANGDATFAGELEAGVFARSFVTATATDVADGATSELSTCVHVRLPAARSLVMPGTTPPAGANRPVRSQP